MAGKDLQQMSDEVSVDEINARLTMQLATSHDGLPWNCTVYFVLYEGSFYWLSFPGRRHSQELAANPNAAIAIVIQPTQPVVGVQAEGVVAIVQDIIEAEAVLDIYVGKYNQGGQFISLLRTGNNKHNLYRLSPKRVMVFDERGSRATISPRELRIT
ncbi:MAG: hypothetical protein JWP06_117 [Candidatus Saccharibacteria bacterium]|nr:hypothetical protein [Candidatus Saccharibacteria bacterium]